MLEIDPPRRLVYSWVGGSDKNLVHGTMLDSVLSIDLAAVEGGTRVKLVHDGFRSPQNDAGYDIMSRGWGSILQRISAIAAELA